MVPNPEIRERWHGTGGGYSNHDCRCADCKAAYAIVQKKTKAKRLLRPVPQNLHGKYTTYGNYGCRCDDCRRAYGARAAQLRGKPYMSREDRSVARNARLEEKAAAKAAKGISYMGAHQRIRRTRGAAKEFQCDFCKNQARDWALIATSLNTRSGFTSRGAYERWSDNPEDYRPLCRKCHKNYDIHVREFGICAEGCDNPDHSPKSKITSKPRDTTKCPNGHNLLEEGARRLRAYDGRMECVECARERTRRYRKSKKNLRVAA